MSRHATPFDPPPPPIEPERYELAAVPPLISDLDRRAFFGVVGGGLVVLGLATEILGRQVPQQRESGGPGRRGSNNPAPREVDAWLHVGEDGVVTGYTGKVEFGQNIRTSLAQAIAEELRLPVGSIRMVMGDTDRTPFDRGTFGSLTTPTMSPQLRKAAAVAREALVDLAATKWGVGRDRLTVAGGRITDRAGDSSIGYGELALGEKLLKTIGDDVPIRPGSRWDVAGRPAPKVDGRAMVTGSHRYTSDLARPGLLHGRVLRPPGLEAKLRSVDTAAAGSIPGVIVVRDGEFVGVVAPDPSLAAEAIEAIRVEWDPSPGPHPSDHTLAETLRAPARRSRPV